MQILKLFSIFFGLLTATNSFALVDLQLLGGYRSASFKIDIPDQGINSESLDAPGPVGAAALHFNIPAIPIALGVSYNYVSLTADDNVLQVEDISGYELGAELYAWLPIGKKSTVQPYIKVGYAFMGDYEIPVGNTELKYKAEGIYGFLGLKFVASRVVKILIEGGVPPSDKSDPELGGVELSNENDFLKINAWSARLGVEFGV